MGQSLHPIPFKEYISSFEIYKQDKQNTLKYYKSNLNNQRVLVRRWVFTTPQLKFYDQCVNSHELRNKFRNPFVEKLLKTETQKILLCQEQYEYYAMWQYNQNSLDAEIKRRSINKQRFTQKQIYLIISSCISALQQMNFRENPHTKLGPQSIKIDQNGTIKLSDPLALKECENFQRVFNRQTDKVCLSPQQCYALQNHKFAQKCYRNDLWALGMVILQAGLLQSQNICYNYQKEHSKIDLNRLNLRIEDFGNIYGNNLKQIVSLMLEPKKERLELQLLKQKIIGLQKKRVNQKIIDTEVDNRESPQVYQYVSSNKQNEIYSFKKNQYPKPSNLTRNTVTNSMHFGSIPYNQKQNILNNNSAIQNRYYLPLKQNTVMVNYLIPTYKVAAIHEPYIIQHYQNYQKLQHSQQIQKFQHSQYYKTSSSITGNNKQNLRTLNSAGNSNITISKHIPEIKKFSNTTSSKGYLFQNMKQPQNKYSNDQFQPPLKHKQIEKRNQQKDKKDPQKLLYIQRTQSITYESDYHHALNKNSKQSYATNNLFLDKQGATSIQEPKKQSQHNLEMDKIQKNSEKQPAISPVQQMKKELLNKLDKNDQDNEEEKLQFVIENFQVGSKYQGYKLRNMRHGEGKFYYQDGGMYNGSWKYNKMDGKGLLYYQSGVLAYDGYWKNDQFEGKGKLYNQGPDLLKESFDYRNFDNIGQFWQSYEGEFVNDMKQGRGKLLLTNGEYLIGNFNADMIEGKGKFFSKQGVIKGVWQANHLVKIQ